MIQKTVPALLVLGGVLIAAQGCGPTTTDDDDTTAPPATETPTPTAQATPEALYFDEGYISVDCDSSGWTVTAVVDGWTDIDSAYFSIFDYTVYCEDYATPPGGCYREEHPMVVDNSYSNPWSEELSLDLDTIGTLPVTEGSSTIFQCANESKLTFALCAEDFYYATGEFCVFFGNEGSYWETNARMSHM